MDGSAQRPLELILARNLLSSLSTPGFLVNRPGEMIFYNEAAGALLGRPFAESGAMPAEEWVATFGPIDENGKPIPLDRQSLTRALRENRAAHARQRIRSLGGEEHDVEVSGVPVIGSEGFQGAMVFFWRSEERA